MTFDLDPLFEVLFIVVENLLEVRTDDYILEKSFSEFVDQVWCQVFLDSLTVVLDFHGVYKIFFYQISAWQGLDWRKKTKISLWRVISRQKDVEYLSGPSRRHNRRPYPVCTNWLECTDVLNLWSISSVSYYINLNEENQIELNRKVIKKWDRLLEIGFIEGCYGCYRCRLYSVFT